MTTRSKKCLEKIRNRKSQETSIADGSVFRALALSISSKKGVFEISAIAERLREFRNGRSLRAELMRGGVGSLAVKAANVGLMFAVTVLLARVLGPSGYGLYAFAFAVATLLAIPAQAGMMQLAVRETAKAITNHNLPCLKALWWWSTRNVLMIAGALVASVGGGLWLAEPWIEGPRLLTLTVALSVVPLLALARVWGAVLRGMGRVVIGQLPDLVLRPGFLLVAVGVFSIGVADVGLTAPTAMVIHAVATGISVILGGWWLWRSAPAGMANADADWQAVPEWWRAALPFVLLGGLQVVNTQADILMLGLLGTDEEVGVYRVVVQMALLVVFGLQAVSQVMQPQFARLYEQRDIQRVQTLATRTARFAAGIALLPVTLFIFFGAQFLEIVFGPDYVSGATPLAILALGQLFNAGMGSVGLILNMTGHERDTMRGVGFAAIANISLNLTLIPLYGAAGAAVATAATLVIWNSVLVVTLYRRIGVFSAAVWFTRLKVVN